MNNKCEQLHETVVRDIIELLDDAINSPEKWEKILKGNRNMSLKSISSASSNLVLVFPVACSRSIAIENSAMVSKAIERKCVSMLQMLFSAFQITDAKDAVDYISKFHKNIKLNGEIGMDDFIAINQLIGESANIRIDESAIQAIKEDMKNINFVLPENVSENSLNNFKIYNNRRNSKIIKEDKDPTDDILRNKMAQKIDDRQFKYFDDREKMEIEDQYRRKSNDIEFEHKKELSNLDFEHKKELAKINHDNKLEDDERQKKIADSEMQYRIRKDKIDVEYKMKRDTINDKFKQMELDNKRYGATKDLLDANKSGVEILSKQVLDSDVKKANELIPTSMVVSFYNRDPETSRVTHIDNIVIGVKAKLYPLTSEDIVNRILLKVGDRNSLLQLIKATTRETSFWKDFIFAIDRAKVDALSLSHRGSSSKLWKVLERRALKSRIKRAMGATNDATAITTLAISQEEVEYIKKNNNIDLERINIVRPLMESLNLMGFVIIDESLEVAKFLFDSGDDMFETVSFTHLERESSDNTYKRIVNLMTKISR